MTTHRPNLPPHLARHFAPEPGTYTPQDGIGSGRSWLQNAVPEPVVFQGSFSHISVPASWTADGQSAWYPLILHRFDDNYRNGLGLFQVSWDLYAPDVNGTLGTNPLAWGTAYGAAARIVLAKNPAISAAGVWTPHPALVAGVEDGTNHENITGVYVYDVSFPTGRITDSTPTRDRGSIHFGWNAVRFGPGDLFVAALVIRGTVIEGSSGTKFINGNGTIRGHFCNPTATTQYAGDV